MLPLPQQRLTLPRMFIPVCIMGGKSPCPLTHLWRGGEGRMRVSLFAWPSNSFAPLLFCSLRHFASFLRSPLRGETIALRRDFT